MFASKILEEKESKYNGHIKVVKTFGVGTYIQAGGLTQSGGIVGTIWKQTIRKIYSHRKEIHRILILGYGGGTIAQMVSKFWPKSKITGIDIDLIIIELGKKYFSFENNNINIIIGDAYNKLKIISEKYDLIFVDLYQGDNFPKRFESSGFINEVKKHLNSDGIMVLNRLYYGDKRPDTVKFGNNLNAYFSKVTWFYPEANLMFICESKVLV